MSTPVNSTKNVVIMCSQFIISPDFNILSFSERVVYLYLRSHYKGAYNDHKVYVRIVHDSRIVGIHRNTFYNALKKLEERKFIEKCSTMLEDAKAYKLLVVCGDEETFGGKYSPKPYIMIENDFFSSKEFNSLTLLERSVFIYIRAKYTGNNRTILMSQKDARIMDCSNTPYYNSMKKLEEKGYITKLVRGSNLFQRRSEYRINVTVGDDTDLSVPDINEVTERIVGQ